MAVKHIRKQGNPRAIESANRERKTSKESRVRESSDQRKGKDANESQLNREVIANQCISTTPYLFSVHAKPINIS